MLALVLGHIAFAPTVYTAPLARKEPVETRDLAWHEAEALPLAEVRVPADGHLRPATYTAASDE